ncbi:hypothetical protein WR164_15040 [Philodulcilactobacillus myokoensis]|uniref:Uncharacterized protein n=1 Tax=Philodulcilactobacillus myokoensis TaxID=2929573 RepID=A0A9W6ET84_9LACO|nr:hypothetical protein [Philodulcilactobacillus myokoensis]GLB47525.1 hypothetical protein WR164_15040 [Philodulcilactobacillus myokoensis]
MANSLRTNTSNNTTVQNTNDDNTNSNSLNSNDSSSQINDSGLFNELYAAHTTAKIKKRFYNNLSPANRSAKCGGMKYGWYFMDN